MIFKSECGSIGQAGGCDRCPIRAMLPNRLEELLVLSSCKPSERTVRWRGDGYLGLRPVTVVNVWVEGKAPVAGTLVGIP